MSRIDHHARKQGCYKEEKEKKERKTTTPYFQVSQTSRSGLTARIEIRWLLLRYVATQAGSTMLSLTQVFLWVIESMVCRLLSSFAFLCVWRVRSPRLSIFIKQFRTWQKIELFEKISQSCKNCRRRSFKMEKFENDGTSARTCQISHRFSHSAPCLCCFFLSRMHLFPQYLILWVCIQHIIWTEKRY